MKEGSSHSYIVGDARAQLQRLWLVVWHRRWGAYVVINVLIQLGSAVPKGALFDAMLRVDLVGGSGEEAFAWDRLVGEALNPTPVARSYSCSDGHLLAAPEPERSASGCLPAPAEQPEAQSAGEQNSDQRDAAADRAVQAADDAGPGRGDAQDGAEAAAGRPAPPEAFVQVGIRLELIILPVVAVKSLAGTMVAPLRSPRVCTQHHSWPAAWVNIGDRCCTSGGGKPDVGACT